MLVEALFEGKLEFLTEGKSSSFAQARAARSYVEDLSILDDDDPKQKKRKDEARRRFKYVNAVLTRPLSKLTKETLDPLIQEVALLLNDPIRPCWSTLYNWVRAYRNSNEDLRVLVPATNKRGNTKPMYSGTRLKEYTEKDKEKAEEVAQVIDLVVQERYLSTQRLSVLATYRFLEGYIKEINKFRKEEDKLPTPHLDSLYYRLSKLDQYEVDVARFGKRYAERKHRQVMQSPRPTRPLERTEIDHTKTNLMVIDLDTKLPIGRATLTDLIDVYTKMPLGSYISFEPPSYLSVMQCLINAIKPKTYIKKFYPEVENAWDCYGLPETIVVDNGNEFHSEDFEDACLQLGIPTEYAPPGCPEYKGGKERYYETLNTQLLHNTPGTTFSDVLNKADYDPQKNALIDVETLKKIHHIYMVDIYARQRHKGIRDVPARLWDESIAVYPPSLPAKGTDLRVLLGHVEYRKIRQQGIELFGLFYNHDMLSILRRETKGQKVKVKYDPTDMSMIYVADSKNGLFIPVPAVDQKYTKGLSLFQHDVIRNYARKIVEAFVDSDALWRARKKIEEIVEQAWNNTRKSSTRAKLARFKGIGLQNHWGTFDQAEVESGLIQSTTNCSQEGELLRLNPEGNQPTIGISDLENVLDTNGKDNHLLEGELSYSLIFKVQNEENRSEKPNINEQRKGLIQSRRKNTSAKENISTETRIGLNTIQSETDGARDVIVDRSDEDTWGADYGRMEGEILKWQRR
ncbi:MAG TPA: transposase family protein [Pyrinomonadaceae bacterium]|nr:transposase family protein [Pyrinomonadaceae bacterium]